MRHLVLGAALLHLLLLAAPSVVVTRKPADAEEQKIFHRLEQTALSFGSSIDSTLTTFRTFLRFLFL
jgi:hypothetical protein